MKKVYDFIKENSLLEKGDNLILGVSGGADSVCLLYILSGIRDEYDLHITAVHVNHMIRETAGRDEEFTLNLCKSLNIECVSRKTDCVAVSEETGLSLEEAGRNERYRIFNEIGQSLYGEDNYKIAVAHHTDDLAETLIFNMIRGTGINGLASIKSVKGNIVRPLLCVTRKEIEEYLKENGISHVDDETNFSDDYARNKIRHKIIPAMNEISEKAVNHTASCAAQLGEIEDYLKIKTDETWHIFVRSGSDGIFIEEKLTDEHPAIVKRVIHKALIEVAQRARDISSVQIDAVSELFGLQTGRKRDLIYNMEALRDYNGVLIRKKSDPQTDRREEILKKIHFKVTDRPISENIPTSLYTKWFDYDKIKYCPIVRFREEGDYLTVNDRDSKKLLSDYMINEKIPLDKRDEIPLLADGKHILWVAGYRISNHYKVSDETKKILVAELIDSESE
ncbi:MAG: tRNA lysidine(34) synthetase TilS [Lachnospiraceae bacterium]|nr:tRNA lysidine(34) synthetase TilS [Lachnospiraceae bacterium]